MKDAAGAASVFVLALRPGDYEFYDFQFFSSSYSPTLGTTTSVQAREKFNLPLRLKAGNAYYLGEFRSLCLGASLCAFRWRDQQGRDEPLARHSVAGLPALGCCRWLSQRRPLYHRAAAIGAGQNILHETRP